MGIYKGDLPDVEEAVILAPAADSGNTKDDPSLSSDGPPQKVSLRQTLANFPKKPPPGPPPDSAEELAQKGGSTEPAVFPLQKELPANELEPDPRILLIRQQYHEKP